tara:strand:+ start:411 stop:1301 length:891 start_codon:yes stop_codon:yes gene_type:complete
MKRSDKYILYTLRGIGHLTWLREGLRVKLIRLFYDYDKIKSKEFEIDYFGNIFIGNLNSFIDWRVFFLGAYEKQELEFLKSIIEKIIDPVFIDIGANIGTHSIYLSNLCEKVYSFEPDNEIKERLDLNIYRNDIGNISTIQKAISNCQAIKKFYSPVGANKGTGSLNYNHAPFNNRKQKEVQTVVGDEYIQQLKLKKIDLIKIDVEGHEIHTINGLEQTIKKYLPILFIEISKVSIDKIRNDTSLIQSINTNYNIFEIKTNIPQFTLFNFSRAKLNVFNWEEIHFNEINIICFPKR